MKILQQTQFFQDMPAQDFDLTALTQLSELLVYHSDLYYNKSQPIISDSEYDSLFKKLQAVEEILDMRGEFSQKVWAELIESSFQKVAHSRPMISLDNTYNEDDLRDFDRRIQKLTEQEHISYTAEFKFDGLGIELIYEDGKLIQAITRWNGLEWEDVTQNIFQIENIPKTIAFTQRIEVRWEVVMPLSSFEMLNKKALKEWGKVFSNPRNAASGSIRMKDNRITGQRKLQFFAYDVSDCHAIKTDYYEFIHFLAELGFDISSYFIQCQNIDEVIAAIENFWDTKKHIDFEIDGLVIKVADMHLWEKIGSTQHHPRYAIAYKFPAELFTTEILSVEHQVWRTGTITPVANLEPVNINGAIIRRATLHNYEEVEKLGLRVGDRVFLKRAGEVIPKIISVASKWAGWDTNNISIPQTCPSCHSEVMKDIDKVRYYCGNKIDCPAQHSEQLSFAVGKQWFNIDGFWVKQVELFLEQGIIKNIVDVFNISQKSHIILELEWFKQKSVDNLVQAVEKAKKTDIATLLCSLWIPWVWKKTAKTLAQLFMSPQDLLECNVSLEDIEALDDIGPEIAKNLSVYLSNTAHRDILTELLEILDITFYSPAEQKQWVYSWKKMCITGSFDWYSRDQLIQILEENGWEFISSVSKKTDYLLAGEKAGSKLKKATELSVVVLSLEEFLEA